MAKPKFKHYPNRPKKLTAEFVKQEYDKLLEQLPAAEASVKPNLWIKLFKDWDDLGAYISSEFARAGYAFSKHMNSKKLEAAEKYLRDKIPPAADKQWFALTKAFVKSRHRSALAKRFGKHLPIIYDIALLAFDPVNTPLGIRISQLSSDYDKIIASGEVKIRGKKVNLYTARSYQFDPDRSLREDAYLASRDWFIKHHRQLTAIYRQMVKLRQQKAKNLGYKNYLPVAYAGMGREGYGQKEVTAFRRNIKTHMVPLYAEICKQQAKALGVKKIKPWDMFYFPEYSLPRGVAPINKQLVAADRLFQKLSPRLAGHFRYLKRQKLIDLETRAHKQSGAYASPIYDEEKVAVLLNSTGDADDIRTLVHELGHAFQMMESMPIEAVDLRLGTAELAEIYSMGMEFLSLPYATEFMKPDQAKKFAAHKWVESVYTLCYVAVVDEFQHWVYTHVGATAKQLDEAWAKIYRKYLPAVDFSDFKQYKSLRWLGQGHIFSSPFYYIDYALAETCAMQLGASIKSKHRQTINEYMKLCKLGGTMSFIDTIKAAGLKSPFKESTVANLAKHAKKELSL